MQTRRSLRRLGRYTAAALLAATLLVWIATGAHRGWTQTTITALHHDEVTGIEYPVQHAGFVAGVEVLAAGAFAAALLAAATFVRVRRPQPVRTR